MKRIIYVALGTMFMMITACTREEESTQGVIYGEAEFYAKYENPRGTKTAIQDNGDIYWSKGDEIDIFNGDNRSVFTSTNTTDTAETTFKGSLDGFCWEKTDEFWAVYPASELNSFGGDNVSLVVKDHQSGYFPDANFPSIAKTSDFDLTFYNICGGIRFKLTEEGIKKVTFRGKNQEPIAGLVTVQFDNDGKPVVSKIEDAKTEITLETGNIYSPGTWWYIVCLPTVLQNGYELILEKESGESAVKESSNTIEIKRSVWGELTKFDGLFPDAVDLGLSVKWAASNLGAIDETDSGNYYAWAETAPKDSYDDASYKWWDSMISMISKYVIKDNYFNSYYGPLDYRYVIEAEDDAASVKYGGDWRMPTKAEIQELINNCSWEWQDNYNGVSGYVVTSKVEGYTDKSIFLPLTGFKWHSEVESIQNDGLYWASNLCEGDPLESWGMIIYNPSYSSSYNKGKVDTWGGVRSQGAVIRPVYGKRIEVTSLAMNKTSLEIGKGQKATLNVTLTPSNAPNFGIIWKSTNESVVTVTDNSRIDTYSHYISAEITAVGFGEATIIAESVDTGVQTVCSVVVREPKSIDLGLSVKWSCLNLGATSEEESGEFFSWGDVQSHSNTTYRTYPWMSDQKLTKYCMSSGYGLNGYVDNKTELDPLDDIVHWQFGGKWRMPTTEEFNELLDETKCSWEWTKVNNQSGYLITSYKTGASIFLPRTGYYYKMGSLSSRENGYYWSSSLDTSYSPNAYSLVLSSSCYKVFSHSRDDELTIRPVYDESIVPITGLVLDKETITLKLGESTSVYATVIPGNATYKDAMIWSSSDDSVASVTEGLIVANKVGKATITADVGGGIIAQCLVTVNYVHPEVVDLGLSKLWATFNLGAKSPEEVGYQFSWGEVEPKDSYNNHNYKWSNGGVFEGSYTKYCNDASYGVNGYVDDLNELLPEDDAACASLGSGWSIPTYNDFRELLYKCDEEWAEVNGVRGLKITSRINNNSIFLPTLTNYNKYWCSADYWSSSLYDNPSRAQSFNLYYSEGYSNYNTSSSVYRYIGAYIRPVFSAK